jgi:hypothetical protein
MVEVEGELRTLVQQTGEVSPFDLVVITNFPKQLALYGSPSTGRHVYVWSGTSTFIPAPIQEAIITAVRQCGNVPNEFETESAAV